MKHLFALLIVVISLWTPALNAGEPKSTRICLGVKLATATLDAASTTFEVEMPNDAQGYDLAIVYLNVVDGGASGITAINMSCTASEDNNSTDATIQDCTVVGGVCTSSDASWTKDPAATGGRWPWRVDISGFEDFECTFTDTGGDASDTIQVYNVCLTTK